MTFDEAMKVIGQVYEGKSLSEIVGKTNIQTFHKALLTYPALDSIYVRAKFARAELIADQIIDIADTEEDAHRARNRIDARKWCASKLDPKTYGDRIDMNISGSVNIASALEDAKKRVMLPGCYQQDIIDAQATDIIDTPRIESTDYDSVDTPKEQDVEDNSSDDIFS
jgi:hypothetical protein